MKKKNRLFGLFSILPLIFATGCKNSGESDLEIDFDIIVPTAYVYEEYDFRDVLIIEKGVSYNLEVYYYDYYSNVEKTLEVKNDYCFTPTELFDLTVIVNAKKGDLKAKRTKTIPVSQKVDPIDELLSSDGFSGWGDNGIMKEPVLDEQYFKGENSHSALSVLFSGSNPYRWGTTFLSLNNFRLLPYWSDQTWENAVVHFWVYNPTEYDLEFQMRVFDKYTGLVDVDWGMAINVPQFAKPNGWSEINFSLKHLGVNHTLYQNEEGTRDDSIIVKVHYGGTPDDGLNLYSYQFYVDDIDVIPYSVERFPDLDTKCYARAETIEYGWENMLLDGGWNRANVLFDRDVVNSTDEHPSLSSMYLSFDGVTLKDGDAQNGYSIILNTQGEFGDDDLPSFRHGTLDFDIMFSNEITNKQVKLLMVHLDWQISTRIIVNPNETENDWLHVHFDFGEHGDCYNITKGIRLGICFPGVTEANKNAAKIHLDNIIFNQNGGIPEDEVEVIRGIPFVPGYAIDLEPIALTKTIILDFKFTSGSDTKIRLVVGDGWDCYYGYYVINYDGTFEGEYTGVSIEPSMGGYYRVTLKLCELNQGQAIENIQKITLLYLQETEDAASGYIDYINPTIY